MATVYLGRDLRHSRQVAVEVLRPELAASLGPDRFLREIWTSRRISPIPTSCPLHDSGVRRWTVSSYVMPFVEGEFPPRAPSVAKAPYRSKKSLRIAGEVAEALVLSPTPRASCIGT